MAGTVVESVCGHTIVVPPEVFNPVSFRSGSCLAEFLRQSPDAAPGAGGLPGALDLGTGTGLQAIVLAARGYRVAAVDLNGAAVRCARANVILNGLEERIEVHEGDLFAPIGDRSFDLVVFNPPFFRGEPARGFDLSWRSRDVMPRFARELAARLNRDGRAIVIWSSHEPEASLLGPLAEARLVVRVLERRRLPVEEMTIYGISAVAR